MGRERNHDPYSDGYLVDRVSICGALADFRDPLAEGPRRRTCGCLWWRGRAERFGTKAGDVFTRITIGIAVVWVLMAVLTGYAMTYESGKSRFESKVTESKDGGAEGAVAPVGATKDNGFEAGSQEKNASPPATSTPKTTTPPQKASGPRSDKSSPATKNNARHCADKCKVNRGRRARYAGIGEYAGVPAVLGGEPSETCLTEVRATRIRQSESRRPCC